MRTKSLRDFITFAETYKIQVIFVVTKIHSLDSDTQRDFERNFENLAGVGPVDKEASRVGHCSFALRPNFFVCFINTKEFLGVMGNVIPPLGVSELRHIIFTMQSIDVKKNLLRLSLSNLPFDEKLKSYGIFLEYHIGIQELNLSEAEYRQYESLVGERAVDRFMRYLTYIRGVGETTLATVEVFGRVSAAVVNVATTIAAVVKEMDGKEE